MTIVEAAAITGIVATVVGCLGFVLSLRIDNALQKFAIELHKDLKAEFVQIDALEPIRSKVTELDVYTHSSRHELANRMMRSEIRMDSLREELNTMARAAGAR